MLSVACRIVVGFSVWFCSISPASAQYEGSAREIAENVTYRLGRHVFVEGAGADIAFPESAAAFKPELMPLLAPNSDTVDAAFTTGMERDLLSDAEE